MLAVELLARVGFATLLGIAIGVERQWRSRMAGMQTMALVSMGSALFLILSAYSFDQEGDRLRVAAQIVSGVGFLGAGVIMKQGVSVTGLNTAATLWATAAVGALAGAWLWREALAGAVVVVAGNWFLQPLAHRMDAAHNVPHREVTPADYVIEVVCRREVESEVSAEIAKVMPRPKFRLRALLAQPARDADRTDLRADYATSARDDEVAEGAILVLARQPGVLSVRWSIAGEAAAHWSS